MRITERIIGISTILILILPVLLVQDSLGQEEHDIILDPPIDQMVQLEWSQTIFESEGYPISTPSLMDADNDNDIEITVYTSNGILAMLRPDGGYFWQDPYETYGPDIAGEGWFEDPSRYIPPFFSSPLVEDINLGDTPEVIIGETGGLVCIGSDGEKQWRTDLTNATVISPPTTGDIEIIETDKSKVIATVVEYSNGSSFLEIYEEKGNIIGRALITDNSSGCSSSVVMEDIIPETSIFDGKNEFIVMHPDEGILVYDHDVSSGDWEITLVGRSNIDFDGYQSSTPVVGNITGSDQNEIVVCLNKDPSGGGPRRAMTYLLGSDLVEAGRIGMDDVVFSSPVAADLDSDPMTKEIIVVSRGGELKVIDTIKNGIEGLEEEWSFDCEDEVLSSPAICDIGYDVEPEIIISTVNGTIFCLDGDPSDGIDEGLPFPGDGIDHDVIWKFQLDEATGISSPVIADIDLDDKLEVLIGSENGNVYCLEIGSTKKTGKIHWPTFHGNNNRNGTYTPDFHALNIYPRRDPETGEEIETTQKRIRPGMMATYNLTVKNTGTSSIDFGYEQINLTIIEQMVPDGWDYFLDTPPHRGNDNPDYVILPNGGMADVQLFVYAPLEGDLNEIAQIGIEARSFTAKGVVETIFLTTELHHVLDYEIFFLEPPDPGSPLDPEGEFNNTMMPGSFGWYTVIITNKGYVNDTYDISLPDPIPGWTWYFLETGTRDGEISLTFPEMKLYWGGETYARFTINITAPDDAIAGFEVPLIVTARSRNSGIYGGPVERNDILTIKVYEVRKLELIIPDERITVNEPRGTLYVPVMLKNHGNGAPAQAYVHLSSSIPGADVTFPEGPMVVNRWSEVEFHFSIRYMFTEEPIGSDIPIHFHIEYDDIVLNGTITIVFGNYSLFKISIDPEGIIEIEPGSKTEYNLTIMNMGNMDEICEISIGTPRCDWKVLAKINEQYQPVLKEFKIMDVHSWDIEVSSLYNAAPGPHDFFVKIETLSGYSNIFNFTVEIQEKSSFRLDSDSDKFFDIQMGFGDEYENEAFISNRGNTDLDLDVKFGVIYSENPIMLDLRDLGCKFEILSIRAEYEPLKYESIDSEEFDFGFPGYSTHYFFNDPPSGFNGDLLLPAGGKIWLTYRITLIENDGTEMVNPMFMSLIVQSIGSEEIERINFDIEVLYPDLEFAQGVRFRKDDGEITMDFEEGENINCNFRILNSGSYESQETSITIFVDDIPKWTMNLLPMKSGDNRTFENSFELEAGRHYVRFEIDANNSVFEENDQFMEGSSVDSNVWTYIIDVEERDGGNSERSTNLGMFIMIMFGSITVLIALIAAFTVLSKRKKEISEE